MLKPVGLARSIGYDNLLWKELCQNTWMNPYFFHLDLANHGGLLRLWYNWNAHRQLSTTEVIALFERHIWRLIYITFSNLEGIPSIVASPRTLFTRRTQECYSTARLVHYSSSVGNFKLIGIKQVSRVEHIVFDYTRQPWAS